MLGAILGDIIGSPYEFSSEKRKDFSLFHPSCRPTDDSLMTIAVGCACVEGNFEEEESFKRTLIERMHQIGQMYPDAGFGSRFYEWLVFDETEPYGSFANGSAMRVSPVAWAADSLDRAEEAARWSAEVTHNHPEGIKGAQAIAAAVYLARAGTKKEEIRGYIAERYYDLDFTVEEIRPSYGHDLSCAGSVPQAIVCFLDSEDYEDAVRNAVSLGGDGDTLACMAGAIAEAYYGIPEELQNAALEYLDETLQELYLSYAEQLYGE